MTVIREYGDAGLLVEPEGDHDQAWATAQGLAASLADDPPDGVVDVVASFRHAFVVFDPVRTDHVAVEAVLRSRLDRSAPDRTPRTFWSRCSTAETPGRTSRTSPRSSA